MKYGKNQWARISSLLVRKSAKQCKARWYEWLDPSIKKTEWTREEDERLLHLAKLMPTQWRTIAPIVGRTPAQCLERYERLLDAACRGEEGYEGAEDPRRLRPGEIDPNPESKPARPDPVDMEEDEKEMLSEARARLANTRGKKAKRKAREKQLEEARRLASLQKRRELKAAGIVSRGGGGRRVQGIDYNNEVAFEKRAPAGFYDTSGEKAAERALADKPFKPVTLAELEGTRRSDIENALRKRDRQLSGVLERHNTPAALAQQAGADGGERKRSRLMLPPPAVSEAEREQLARLVAAGGSEALLAAEGGSGGSDATRALLADYGATPRAAAPLRTPRVPTQDGRDFLLQEAQNLAMLQQGATPLLGGANPELHASDFTGATPQRRVQATPHPLALPTATPARAPGETPLRDGLGINAEAAALHEGRSQAEVLRAELRKGLASLPAPRNEYQIVMPELEGEAEEEAMEEDASNLLEARRMAEAAALEAALRRRSHAVQRGLPRPASAPAALSTGAASAAEEMLRCELARLIAHDAELYPPRAGAAADASAPPLEALSDEALLAAGALVRQEAQALRYELGHEQDGPEEHAAAHCAVAPPVDLRAAFQLARTEMERQARRAAKLDARAALITSGFQRRAEELQARLEKATAAIAARSSELAAFQCLHAQEVRAAPLRIESLAGEIATVANRERDLQQRYGVAARGSQR